MKWHSHISDFENALPNTGLYVERALNLYRELIPKGRGKLVFIAGERGSGRSELLNALAEAFPGESKNVQLISGKFVDGKYLAISAKGGGFARNADLAGNILSFLSKAVALKTGLPIDLILQSTAFLFDFIGQLLQTSATVKGVIDELNANPPNAAELPGVIRKLLRTAARDSPIVCLFENFDEARFEWYEFLDGFAEEIDRDVPILFFISIRGGAEAGKNQEGESISEMVTRRAISRGLAEWWRLPPLTRDEITEWIGAETEPGMVGQLHGVTGGIPRWVREIWRDWKTNGFTHFNEERRRWEWSKNKKPTLNPFNDILKDLIGVLLHTNDLRQIDDARELLATAALEGKTFTAEALALALNRDTDDLINFLDEFFVQTEENPSGILREEGFLAVEIQPGSTRNIFRYSFVSDWHWQVLNRYALTDKERADKRDEMITALKIAYEGDECLVAGSLSELYRNTGNVELARHFRTMASYSNRREILYQQAVRLMTVKIENWNKFQCYQYAKFLLEAGNATARTIPYNETIEIYEHAENAARKAEEAEFLANAILRGGFFYQAERENAVAREKAAIAKKLFEKIKSGWGQSACLVLLARIAYSESDYKDAREKAAESFRIQERINDRDGKAASMYLLSDIAYSEGDYKDAREKAIESLRLYEEIDHAAGKAASIYLLAQLAHSESYYQDARKKAIESLRIQEEIGDREGKAASMYLLARISYSEGNYKDARDEATESLLISEEIGDRDGKASSLNTLAKIAYLEGDYKDAREMAAESLLIHEEIGDRDGKAASLNTLAKIAYLEGDYKDAREMAAESLLIQKEIDHIEGKASSLNTLAKIAYSEGNYTDAREKATESFWIQGEIGDRVGKTSSLNILANIASNFDNPILAIRLSSLSLVILSHIGSGEIEVARADLTRLANSINLSEEQINEYLTKAEAEYAKDEGKSWSAELLQEL